MSDYLDQVVNYICQCEFVDLPSDVIERAKEVIADSIAVIAAGAQEEEVKALTERMVNNNGPGGATLIGAGLRSEPLKACFINGTAGTFLELDEGNQFGRGHPGIQIIPAVLAVAEEKSMSGKELLTALVMGYEISTRIGIACKLRMSMHPHGTWGTVGAAIALGKLMGYTEAAMREIISVSSSMITATNRRTMLEGGTVRNVYAGFSSHNGLLAHYMIDAGFTGESDGMKTVFGSVVSDSFLPEVMTDELGSRFEIARNYFKRHACCRYNHSALDAIEAIAAKLPGGRIQSEKVVKVDIMTYSLAAQLCDQNPKNSLAAKFSIPFAIASFIVNGHAGVSSFTSKAVRNPLIRALAQKITVSEDPSLTDMMPERRPSRVRLTMKDGKVFEAETFINKGDTEDPYSHEELKEKYFELVEPVWGHEMGEKIYNDILTLEALQDTNELTGRMSL